MKDNDNTNNTKCESQSRQGSSQPALFLVTKDTFQYLSGLFLTFSIALTGVSIRYFESDDSLICFHISTLLFLVSAIFCVKTQSWDFFSISKERRKFMGLDDTQGYKTRCWRRMKLFHYLSVLSFHTGILSILIGSIILLKSTNYYLTPIIITIFFLVYFVVILLSYIFKDRSRNAMECLEQKAGIRNEAGRGDTHTNQE
jgi:hypothetical protein